MSSDPAQIAALQAQIERLREEACELRSTNKDLLVYKQQLDAILNNAPVEIYLKDREGRYLRINKEFEQIFNVRNEDLVGLLPSDVHDNELAASTRDHDLHVLESGLVERREELAKLASDQQMHTLLTIKFPVFDDDGDVDGLGAIVTDITERRQAEEAIRRVQKMDAMGELTGGIAHDFNNILGIVLGNLELIRLSMPADHKLLAHVDAAYKGASRGAAMTRKLLRFSQSSREKTKPLQINEFLNTMEEMVGKTLPSSICTTWAADDELWAVSVDSGELEDAILNLSLNARDAMPEGGLLQFAATNVSTDAELIRGNSRFLAGEYLLLSVSDNGEGMSPSTLKRATEPFFTTKSASKGTGLGLSVVYGFVSRSGGHMDIASSLGKGTRIEMYFPRSECATQAEPVEVQAPKLPRGNETILVVDDEQALLEVAVSHLQDLGYTTRSASNSQQALHILLSDTSIDLLFSDVIMPGRMNGCQLALKAQEICPALKLLITSGFTHRYDEFNVDESELRADLIESLLPKPYDKLNLAIAVRDALDSSTSD